MASNLKIEKVCKYCGNVFTAKKTVTKYCSLKCAQRAYKVRVRKERIEKSNIQTHKQLFKSIEEISNKPFLNIMEVCQLIGVCRKTIYNLIQRGEIKAGKIGDRVIIKRESIDTLLSKYTPSTGLQESIDINEYYTIKDVEAIYNIKYGRLREILSDTNIETKLNKRKLLIPKLPLDTYFNARSRDVNTIIDWYSITDITTIYGINRDTIYKLSKVNNIPKKQVGKFVYLSRWHFDNLGLKKTV